MINLQASVVFCSFSLVFLRFFMSQETDKFENDRKARFASAHSNKYIQVFFINQLKAQRTDLMLNYIKEKKMADPDLKYSLSNAVKLVPLCMDMCPEFERHEREFTNSLDSYEKTPGTDKVDHEKAVKRFKRSAAGDPLPLPCDVRPPSILVVFCSLTVENVRLFIKRPRQNSLHRSRPPFYL
jgi:hypothetical protein